MKLCYYGYKHGNGQGMRMLDFTPPGLNIRVDITRYCQNGNCNKPISMQEWMSLKHYEATKYCSLKCCGEARRKQKAEQRRKAKK